jgi:hypothetical protein
MWQTEWQTAASGIASVHVCGRLGSAAASSAGLKVHGTAHGSCSSQAEKV